jgi:hypothetical protein
MEIPEGWTDDMSIAPPDGVSVEQVVDLILDRMKAGAAPTETHKELRSLGLSCEDADLAQDRVMGGLVRAATISPENEPRREKDLVAWVSYHRGRRDAELIALVGWPASAPTARGAPARPWWRFWGRS